MKDLRAFLLRGNVLDLAVAVIIGAAFGAIVTSLVNDIIMPLIGILLGGIDFTALSVQVGDATITYGLFIQAIINFIVIGVTVFFVVKYAGRLFDEKEAAPAAPPEPSAEEKLLTEIRDLLKERS
ncbi:MAG: large-conductance mechanosensitive channel protein MscL [Caldilineae bacterium]|nr:large-conductance mechanosensitive channel protein MscL [Anaerolineae bacterium]MCB0198507.1 large-conductance mechanosensitive channel protein MscL [Anaerolineae bacterium]MCB0205875.1 large-conductance mechanosensitive channel protein MscL [Anaerolineae bacterium]MCB0255579.1 large-conductance mechanosensitive channel protein MscL [Anaerolineae bacterium]MCB9152971.1 large-conductance mechanosensitive channel protein MscL [Caldilineae bacterium]